MADDRRSHQVSLGCGTLILIALIVLFFSGRGTGDLEHEVHGLRTDVSELKNLVQVQINELKLLQQKLDKQQGSGGAAKDK